jgi:hypothetical protein
VETVWTTSPVTGDAQLRRELEVWVRRAAATPGRAEEDEVLAAIGQVLPVAVGIAISSVPIVVVVLVLVTGPAAGADLAFLVGWLAGLTTVGALVLALADVLLSDASQPRWANLLRVVLGVLLLFLAGKKWRGRRPAGSDASSPGWMASLDDMAAPKALGLGFLLGSVNPKNAILMISGAAAIVAETAVVREQIVALIVLVVIASAGVAAPVVAGRVLGDGGRAVLGKTKSWLAEHNAVVTTVVLLVLGTVLLGNGLGGLDLRT